MAPASSRPHPYRAPTEMDTPNGPIISASWIAGPRNLPGGIEPPPVRPILILVDYSPLQELTHPSEPNHELFNVLASSNFRNVSAGELEALFTWARLFPPDEAALVSFRELRTAMTTRLRTQWDIHMVASDLEFRFADLQGDVFQVPPEWSIKQLLEEYRPDSDWRIRQYNYIRSTPLVPGTSHPFILRLQCHKVRQGVILPELPWTTAWSSAEKNRRCICRLIMNHDVPTIVLLPHIIVFLLTLGIMFWMNQYSGSHI